MNPAKEKIKILVVEGSAVALTVLVQVLGEDSDIQVIGTARNGLEAMDFLATKTPDVILMDIDMPEMGGFEATRQIMESRPTPIVVCSVGNMPQEAVTSFRLMEAGAVACVEKPITFGFGEADPVAQVLRQTVKLMSEVKVVRRWPRRDGAKSTTPLFKQPSNAIQVVGIGASTGGPPVLQVILSALPKDFPVPLLIVQHIAPGFLGGLADWLNQTTGLKVHIGAHGMQALPGHVYLAPDDLHMAVRPGGALELSHAESENGLRPSVAHLFRSLAHVYTTGAVGIMLTGMGKDGAQELKQMKDRGAVTIVQDRESSVVHGMPGEAIALGAATHVLPTDRIAGALAAVVNRSLFS